MAWWDTALRQEKMATYFIGGQYTLWVAIIVVNELRYGGKISSRDYYINIAFFLYSLLLLLD